MLSQKCRGHLPLNWTEWGLNADPSHHPTEHTSALESAQSRFSCISPFSHVSFPSKEQMSFNFMAAVAVYIDFEAQEMKICHCFQFILFNLPWSDGTGFHDLSYWMFSSQLFHSSVSPSSGGSLVPLHFLPLRWYHLHIWDYWYFSQQYWFQLVIHPAWHFTWYTLHRS